MDYLEQLLGIAHTGGAAAAPIFIVLWWLERSERKEEQAKNDSMAERVITAMVETKAALNSFGVIFGARSQQ